MNILIFSITYFPFVGGAEVAVKEITDRVGEDNSIKFDLITAKLDKKLPNFERIGNVNVYRIGYGWKIDKYLYPASAYFKANKLHRERRYDIVQAIMANYAGLAALLFKLKNKDARYLLTEQSGDSDFFMWMRTWFWYPLYKMIYTRADYVQVISNWLARRVRKYGYKGEIKIAPNGVDIGKFSISNSQFSKNELRKNLGIGDDEKIIITASRLVAKNGTEDLIRGIGMLCKKDGALNKGLTPPLPPSRRELTFSASAYGKIKLLIAGTGKLEKKLKKLVNKLVLQNNVIFLGQILQDDLPRYLWASDIFCRPSLSEGLGISFLESMAAGVPIIATCVGGIPDFLEDKKTGLFCKARNPESIADAIIRLLSDKKLYDSIAENGRRLVEERYDWKGIALQMKRIYEKMSKSKLFQIMSN